MRKHDDIGARRARRGGNLADGVNGDALLGQNAGDIRQHAGLVRDAQAQVIARDGLFNRQHRQFAHFFGLEGEMRHAVFRVGSVQAGDIDEVGNHRAGGGFRARTGAVVEGFADGVGLHQHGVHGAINAGQKLVGFDQRGVHAQFNALLAHFGDAEQLDAVAELFGVGDVDGLQLRDAFNMRALKLHRHAEGDGAHDGGFVRGIDAFDVEGRVGLGVAEFLRLFQRLGKRQPLVAHFGEDEVGGAVDNPGNPLDAVGRQAFAQRLDDRNASGHGSFKGDHHAFLLRGGENFVAVLGEQRLVRGHDVFAVLNGGEHQITRHGGAANQFDDDVNLRIRGGGEGVVNNLRTVTHHAAGVFQIAVGHRDDANRATGAAGDFFAVAVQNFKGAASDGTDAQQGCLDCFHGQYRKINK